MANENEIVETVRKFGIDILIELSEQLLRYDKKASARLLNSLTYDLRVALPNIFIDIIGEDYYGIIEEGAKPHTPPLSKIKEWCTYKGIDLKYAYPVQQKIGKFGISPTPILSDILSNRGLEFEKVISDKYRLFIEGKLNEIIKKA